MWRPARTKVLIKSFMCGTKLYKAFGLHPNALFTSKYPPYKTLILTRELDLHKGNNLTFNKDIENTITLNLISQLACVEWLKENNISYGVVDEFTNVIAPVNFHVCLPIILYNIEISTYLTFKTSNQHILFELAWKGKYDEIRNTGT